VCASISCPEIRDEAYVANKLETQLEKQATKFINDPSRNKFDLKNREAEISEIFNWFEEDFGNDEEEVLLYIAKYLPEEITNDIINNLTEWDVSYMNYNWGLNEYVKND
jgi:phosphoglycerate-specific signal transduction histidine kinase